MEPLDAARDLFDRRFPDAVAGFLGGSVLTTYRTTTSDLDIVVVLPQADVPYRQTIRHQGWLVELFVHTHPSLKRYWALDAAARKASLLRMCADGHILRAPNELAISIQTHARHLLAAGPPSLSGQEREQRRYRLTDLLDDLIGCHDSAELAYLAAALLTTGSELILLASGRWLDTGKWLARRLTEIDGDLAARMIAAHLSAATGQDMQPLQQVMTEILERVGGPLREGFYAPGSASTPTPEDQHLAR